MPRVIEKAKKAWAPKSYKELVDWYVEQIDSGTATTRNFKDLARGLVKPKKKAKPKK